MSRLPPRRTLDILGRQAERVSSVSSKSKRRTGNRKTRQAAKSAERAMQRALVDAVEAAREATDRRALEVAIAQRNVADATRALGWESAGEPTLQAGHAEAYRRAFEASARLEADALGSTYAVINRNALIAMEQAGARFVTAIGEGTRTELRGILTDMVNQGLSIRETATRLMDRIGLTERLSTAVDKFGEGLVERGWTPERIARAVARKARELLRYRARLIAQTEAQNAAAAGQRASWAEAAAQGLLDVGTAEQEWVTSSKPCPAICEPIDGQRRKLGELFETGDGRLIAGPGGDAHPNCLCTVIMHANRGSRAEAT